MRRTRPSWVDRIAILQGSKGAERPVLLPLSQPTASSNNTSYATAFAPARFRSLLADLLLRFASRLEQRPAIACLALVLVYVPAVLAASHGKPLSHDELFTLYISRARNLHDLFRDIRLIDLNPPLSYLLTRLSLRVVPAEALACRLPEMLAFLVAMLALFTFVRRRIGTLFGLLAAALLFSSLAGEIAILARPYALLLAFFALALVSWQGAVDLRGRHRAVALLTLALSVTAMLLSHVFALLAWSALAAAELARGPRRRRADTFIVLALTAPLVAGLSYLPMLRNHAASSFPPAFQPTGEDIFVFYFSHIDRELTTLWLTSVAILILLGRRYLRGSSTFFFTFAEWTAVILTLALPAVQIALLMHAHGAFFPRYGVIACFGAAVLAAGFLAWWTARDLRAALLGTVIALLISGQIGLALRGLPILLNRHPLRASEPFIEPCQVCAITNSIDPTLPIVDSSGLTFLEMDHRESAALLHRVYFLTNPAASMQFAHASIFEGMALEQMLFPIRANVETYPNFLRQHTRFFVYGQYDYPEDWLLRKLQADRADIRVRARIDSQYRDRELYEVTTLPAPISHGDPE